MALTEGKAVALARLARGICRCTRCPLHQSRTHAVPGEGEPNAAVMLVGEAPGQHEDAAGRPFIGRSGQFLTGLLEAAGFDRSDLFITNSVKCRPPNDRVPHKRELDICRETWLLPQIAVVNPAIILLLGRTPLQQLIGITDSLDTLHGRVFDMRGTRLFATYHPAAGMRFPAVRDIMRRDFRKLRRLLGKSA